MTCTCVKCMRGVREWPVYEDVEEVGGEVHRVLVRIEVARCPRCGHEGCGASFDHRHQCVEEFFMPREGK